MLTSDQSTAAAALTSGAGIGVAVVWGRAVAVTARVGKSPSLTDLLEPQAEIPKLKMSTDNMSKNDFLRKRVTVCIISQNMTNDAPYRLDSRW